MRSDHRFLDDDPPAPRGRSRLAGSTPGGRPWPSQEECTLAKAAATSTKLRPLGDRVVVKPTPREEMTKSGIVLPDAVKEKPQEGTVLAVGPGRYDDNGKRIPIDVVEGDVVIYSKYGGTEVKYSGKEYLLLSARDVLAKVAK